MIRPGSTHKGKITQINFANTIPAYRRKNKRWWIVLYLNMSIATTNLKQLNSDPEINCLKWRNYT